MSTKSTSKRTQTAFNWQADETEQAIHAALADDKTGRITITRVHDEFIVDIETRGRMRLRLHTVLFAVITLLCGHLLAAPKNSKMFPANHGSVALENQYADGANLERFEDMVQVASAVRAGILTEIPITVSPKLPADRRYVRPAAHDFLLELDARFYQATGHFLIVDSAVRPVEVQRRLARRNRNAAPATGERASSHERGTTFDLAKKMAGNGHIDRIPRGKYRWLLVMLAYYQGIGRVHVIEERACLHIMVREDNNGIQRETDERSVQAEVALRTEGGGDELHAMQAYDDPRRQFRRS